MSESNTPTGGDVTMHLEQSDDHGEKITVMNLKIDVPEQIVEEIREQGGQVDADSVIDRVEFETRVDGQSL